MRARGVVVILVLLGGVVSAEPAARYAVVRRDLPLYLAPRADANVLAPAASEDGLATYRVLGESGGFVALQSLAEKEDDGLCEEGEARLADLRLRLFARRADLVEVARRPLVARFRDGTSMTISPGRPIKRDGARIVDAYLDHVRFAATPDAVGVFFAPAPRPGDAILFERDVNGTLGGEPVLFHGAVTGVDRGKRPRLTARGRCMELTVLADPESAESPDDDGDDEESLEGGVEGGLSTANIPRHREIRSGSSLYHPDGQPAGILRWNYGLDVAQLTTNANRACFVHRSGLTLCVDPRDVTTLTL